MLLFFCAREALRTFRRLDGPEPLVKQHVLQQTACPAPVALIPALAQVLWHYRLIRGRSREGCFRAFRLNHWLGFTVFAGIAASYALA